jgi:hypothetical protein
MADRIRVIPHYPEGIPDCGSFEVRFADGRESQWFYWDNNPGRASITRKMDRDEAREAARALARAERAKLGTADWGEVAQLALSRASSTFALSALSK